MPGRRGPRLVVEVLFLLALALGLAFADVRGVTIVAVMLAGWAIAAAFEWASWRDEPHYAAGFPPRYHVPRVELPPSQPLEQVAPAYPEARRDEAPTWIASAALRAEVLGDWPVASPATEREEHAGAAAVSEDTQPEAAAGPLDPWLVAELPAAPLERQDEPEPESAPVPRGGVPQGGVPQGSARYSLDPLGEPSRRRFGRGGEPPLTIEVPARPSGPRKLPGRAR